MEDRRRSEARKENWFLEFTLGVLATLSNIRRLILCRIPARNSEYLPALVGEITLLVPDLERCIVQDSVVSIEDAEKVFSLVQKFDGSGHQNNDIREDGIPKNSEDELKVRIGSGKSVVNDYVLRRRLPEKVRQDIERSPPKGFQMIFVGVCHSVDVSRYVYLF